MGPRPELRRDPGLSRPTQLNYIGTAAMKPHHPSAQRRRDYFARKRLSGRSASTYIGVGANVRWGSRMGPRASRPRTPLLLTRPCPLQHGTYNDNKKTHDNPQAFTGRSRT
jgi:hypothetical protein